MALPYPVSTLISTRVGLATTGEADTHQRDYWSEDKTSYFTIKVFPVKQPREMLAEDLYVSNDDA